MRSTLQVMIGLSLFISALSALLYHWGLLQRVVRAMAHRVVVMKDGKVVEEQRLYDGRARIRDVRVAPDGAVWLTTDEDEGKVLRVTP